MKHIIEFNLPEENEDLEYYFNSRKAMSAMYELEQLFRNATKYGSFNGRELTETEVILFEEIRSKFYEINNDYGVSL